MLTPNVITSPNSHKKIVYKNALDKTIKITQNDGTSVYYSYDALGNLTQTKVGNRVTTITQNRGQALNLHFCELKKV